MKGRTRTDAARGRSPLGSWSFSSYERRALWFLVALILAGSAFRYWRHQEASRRLEIWAGAADSLFAGADSSSAVTPPLTWPLDLNRASVAELQALPGIGTVKASRIVEYRRQHGLFARVEELDNVHGIGPKTIARLKPYLTVK